MIYFIHGPDRYLARQSAVAVAAELDPAGTNTTWVDGRETTPDRLIPVVGSATFFNEPRVVIVADLLGRAGRDSGADKGENESSDRKGRGLPNLAPLLAAVPSQNCLILFEPGLASAPAALKSQAPELRVIAAEAPRGRALLDWIVTAAERAGSQIDQRAAQYLAESLFPQTWDRKPPNPRFDRPPVMALLSSEIDKLALAAHPGPIETRDILEMVPGGPDQRLFRFIDAAVRGDLRAATIEQERLIAAGEEPAMTLSQLLGQLELAAVAQAAANRDAAAVARDLGTISPARVSAVLSSTRRAQELDRAVSHGASIDRRLKRGRIRQPDDALRLLTYTLAEIAQQQQTGRPR